MSCSYRQIGPIDKAEIFNRTVASKCCQGDLEYCTALELEKASRDFPKNQSVLRSES